MKPDKIEDLARTSPRAGVMGLVGALVIFGSLGFAAWRLTRLDQEISEKKEEVAAKENELASLQARVDDLKQLETVLTAQRDLAVGQIQQAEREPRPARSESLVPLLISVL